MMRYMDEHRRRAPRRTGHRTTLRVPDDVMRAAERLATELGTTPNDALVQLAEAGAAATDRRRRAEQIASARREAVGHVGFADMIDFPTAEDLHAAMISGRNAP
jgi:hypothetical protein